MRKTITWAAAGAAMMCAVAGGAGAAESLSQPELVKRGDYLVNTVMACGNCHTPMGPQGPDTSRFLAGGFHFDTPGFKVTASNLTSHSTGLGDWSDEEIKTAIRTGHRPDGSALAPVMPTSYYKILTPGDLDAVVAYLRTVPPVDNKVLDPVYDGAAPPAFPGAETPLMEDAQAADPVEKGRYLVTIAHCMECHMTREPGAPLGGGGLEIPGPWGVVVSANITSDPEHGLGNWSDEEIVRAITTGISRDGKELSPPMGYPYYAHMTPEDLSAMVAYLRTIPPAP
ncbi:hypothetical protein ATO13_11446 [Stappia sp. 22II-S9-Z10]|nr:hypothetical protein ATO13_11446 [Stappia sp. 22II-S9-Z10]